MPSLKSLAPCALAVLLTAGCNDPGSRPEHFELLIRGGQVVDGTGAPAYPADLGVRAGLIARVGRLEGATADRVIEAAGLTVAPGIIDIHTHSDYSLLVDGAARSKVRQGVTTEVLGEATSAGPFPPDADPGRLESAGYGIALDWSTLGEYFQRLEQSGIAVNAASFVGSMTVRRYVLGETNREPTAEEIARMAALVEAAMEQGALGVATALLGSPLTTRELTAMAEAAARHGGSYSTHIRDEGSLIFESLDEAIAVGQAAGAAVDVLHLKIAERRLWGQMDRVLAKFETARAAGLEITANIYPYIAGQNNLSALIPPAGWEGGRAAMLERLKDPAWRQQFREVLYAGGLPNWYNHYTSSAGWESILIASTTAEANRELVGMTMDKVIERRLKAGMDPADVLYDLLLEEQGSVPAIYFLMTEEDVKTAMRAPFVSFGSDGAAVRPDGPLGEGKPHPRWYGTFPRVLGRYVREQGVLTLEEAIRKMTAMNADKIGLTDRGRIAAGLAADLFIFDPATIIDRATFDNPHQYAEGVEYVIVNGIPVLERGEHTAARPGKVLYGPGRKQ